MVVVIEPPIASAVYEIINIFAKHRLLISHKDEVFKIAGDIMNARSVKPVDDISDVLRWDSSDYNLGNEYRDLSVYAKKTV